MKYDRACLRLSKEEISSKIAANEPHVVRLLVPEGKTTFVDEIRGEITIDNKEVDDQVLLKTDGRVDLVCAETYYFVQHVWFCDPKVRASSAHFEF